MTGIKKKLGMRLFQLRKDAGITQAKLAADTNLSIDLISRIERGERSPSLETIEKISKALNIRPVDLLNFDNEEIRLQAECPFEVMELWRLLKEGKPHHVKKICQIAKIIIG